MGHCYCTKSPVIHFNQDIPVPKASLHSSNPSPHSISQKIPMNKKISRMRSFMKVKSIKCNKNTKASTEQILTKTKTINPSYGVDITHPTEQNGLNNTKVYYSPKRTPKKQPRTAMSNNNLNSIEVNHMQPTTIEQSEGAEAADHLSCQAEDIEVIDEHENKVFTTLKNHYLFRHFDDHMLQLIINNSLAYQVEAGSTIYNEGDIGESFFMIQYGIAEQSSSLSQEKTKLSTGDTFGEMALIYSQVVRTQTVIALTKLDFYLIFGSSYRETSKNFSKHSIEQIIYFLNGDVWLENVDPVIKLNLSSLTTIEEYEKNEVIFSNRMESNELEKIYLVKSGIIDIISFDSTRTIYPKDCIGDIQVILGLKTRDDIEIVAAEASSVYAITRQALIEAIGVNFKDVILFSMFQSGVKRNSFFKNILLECHYTSIFELFKFREYSNEMVVYSHLASKNKKAVLILEGELVDQDKAVIASRGVLFGDEIINLNENLPCKVYAQSGFNKVMTMEAEWIDIRNILEKITRNSSLDVFKRANKVAKMYLFKHIAEAKILELCQLMKKVRFSKDDVIISEKEAVNSFYVISRGRIRIMKQEKLIREIDEGNCFGEVSLLKEEKSDVSLIALDEVQCYTLDKAIFLQFLKDENMNDYIKKKMCLEDTNIELNDLYHVAFLGRGKFGSVSLVHNCISLYAIKTVPKLLINNDSALSKYMLSEKNILLSLDYPLIVKLVKTLKTEHLCFFLMEHINGHSLEEYISLKKTHKYIAETRFFGACLALILNYLNKKSITHRDVKPSNLIIDSTGYLKIVDFGTAKKIKDYAFTLIGTPNCIAPEILLGKGYSFPCDYWSLGCCMFYSFYGFYPFGHGLSDVMAIYDQVMNKEINFPKGEQANWELNCFLSAMLNKRPANRLCTLLRIENDPFYKGFEWKELKNFKMKPPLTLKGKEKKDVQHALKNTRHPFISVIMKEKFDLSSFSNEEKKVSDNFTMRDYSNWFYEF